MSIVLTSFKRSGDYSSLRGHPQGGITRPYSAAVYQPRGFSYPKLDFWDIRDDRGNWTRPREYRGKLIDLYASRIEAINDWLHDLDHTAVLCCWCPYDRAAQRQLRDWGSFVCHTAVMYEVLRGLGVEVLLDPDRDRMVKLWEIE
jgi:hypothetical protein